MNRLSCGGARRRLSAFHDDELPVEEQVAVEAHLRACVDCAQGGQSRGAWRGDAPAPRLPGTGVMIWRASRAIS